ncbi:hypothetical protein HDV05_007207 [Chytridiales sp. JEL 0842]|nr:hypothetical protein HDV05_007207 [Chytridiales sp. JEL 0842]
MSLRSLLHFVVLYAFVACWVKAQIVLPTNRTKGPHSISIAAFYPFALNDTDTLIPDPQSLAGAMMGIEASLLLSVESINMDPGILPNIHVNLVKFNNWDPNFSRNYFLTDSGGYSAAAALQVASDPNNALDIQEALRANNVNIITVMTLQTGYAKEDVNYVLSMLRNFDARPVYTVNQLLGSFGYFCRSTVTGTPLIAISVALYAYNAVLLLAAAVLSYLTRNVNDAFSESTFMLLVSTATCLGVATFKYWTFFGWSLWHEAVILLETVRNRKGWLIFHFDGISKTFVVNSEATYTVVDDVLVIQQPKTKPNPDPKAKLKDTPKSFTLCIQFPDNEKATNFYNQLAMSMDSFVKPKTKNANASGFVTIAHT